jgi:hypothetical protein
MSGYIIPLLDPGGESDKNAVLLGTRKTRHIPNEKRPEWSKEDLSSALQEARKLHPNAKHRSVTHTYNCVGMAFVTRRTWVDPEYVYTFLNDDDYQQIAQSEAQVGDVVVYKDRTGDVVHVGIVIQRDEDLKQAEIRLKILSKWGPWAEFIHDPDDVLPAFGKVAEIWTDRKLL